MRGSLTAKNSFAAEATFNWILAQYNKWEIEESELNSNLLYTLEEQKSFKSDALTGFYMNILRMFFYLICNFCLSCKFTTF